MEVEELLFWMEGIQQINAEIEREYGRKNL
jgi:hypothetical protein